MPDEKQSTEPGPAKNPADTKQEGSKIATTEWIERKKPIHRDFPGPRGSAAPLRVAFERGAFADVIAHAKESLKAEICGALAGDVCEDAEGPFVHIKAAIRGSAAKEGSTHVTFTQETWNTIHKTIERQFPKLQIVGWYHSHPGFGVEFSEMDTFIQRNFFPAPTQIAFVTDPLGGDAAICFNTPEGIQHLDRFWVDGREHQAKAPAREVSSAGTGGGSPGATGKLQEELRNLEARLNQVLQGLEEQRRRFSGTLMTLFIFVAMSVALFLGWSVWQSYSSRAEPPKLNSYIQVPIQLGDKTVLVGLQVVDWQVPPEMNALLLKLEKAQREAVEKALKEAGTNGLPGAITNAPAAKP
ncbi:MAG: hypothetical protein QOF48_1724 [Verrucomicrobiota bacterium]|jgi:proteasome lid subunit RPN8/RPN11